MPYTYSRSATRYRDNETGRFVSGATVRGYLEDGLFQSGGMVAEFTQQLFDGDITADEWRAAMRDEIKDEYIRQYLLGSGGLNNMTPEDWGSIGGMIADQYRYLESFHEDLDGADFSVLALGAVAARARMYTNSAREGYERAYRRSIDDSGAFGEEKWTLSDVEHCSDCIDLAGRGWVAIGELPTVPGAGATQCLSNCKCSLDYR